MDRADCARCPSYPSSSERRDAGLRCLEDMSSIDGSPDDPGRFMRHRTLARVGLSGLAMLGDDCDEEELPFLRCHWIDCLGFSTLLEALEEQDDDSEAGREEE